MKTRLLVVLMCALGGTLSAQVTYDRVLHADREPQNWLTYGGGYSSQRYSPLTHLTRDNVKNLSLKWVWRPKYLDKMETTPLVVDGVMYAVQNSDVVAIDAATGRIFWTFHFAVDQKSNAYLMVSKGLAIAGDRLFWATYDGHLIAIDARSGKALWNKTVLDYKTGLQFNVAPLVVKDKVILGPATNEFGTNCWIAAFDVRTGSEVWRFKTVPEPGEKGNETWPGDSWQHGGAPIWVTGSYDPDTNLTFWGTGNPNPGWNGGPRNPGDNLYADSVVALDVDTGKLKWHYQFTPNDEFDWDSVQVPVLADLEWQGRARKVMLWANRNGFYLRARSREWPVPAGQGVRQAELESRLRQRPPDQGARNQADTGRHARHARDAGRHQLVFAVVQSSHGSVLHLGLGQLRGDLAIRRRAAVAAVSAKVHGEHGPRQRTRADGVSSRSGLPDRRRRLRRRPRDRPEDRRKEVGLQDGGLHRERRS